MATPTPMFGTVKKCRACGCKEEFLKAHVTESGLSYIRRRCLDCGYRWNERPLYECECDEDECCTQECCEIVPVDIEVLRRITKHLNAASDLLHQYWGLVG